MFIQLSAAVGINVLYSGSRVYVTVAPKFKNKTSGLCGTFNQNQNDDFRTPEGIVDSNPTAFGNSWKMDATCKQTVKGRHPCDVQVQKAAFADKKCNKLKLSPFTKCHQVVDPENFIYACRYDVCGCLDGVNCLCNAVAAYTKECAEHGVIIEWRNNNILPECSTCLFFVLHILIRFIQSYPVLYKNTD